MNEVLIENWNECVKPQDKIWHLGDVLMGPQSEYRNIMSRLNGHKRLTLGNHDKIKQMHQYFDKIELWKIFKEQNFTMSHFPLREDQLRTDFNLHGHIHQNDSPTPRHINMCVEKTNYKPVHLDEILEMIKKI